MDSLSRTFTATLLLNWLTIVLATPTHGAETLRYSLEIAPNGKALTVTICDPAFSRSRFSLPKGAQWRNNQAEVESPEPHECASYRQKISAKNNRQYFELNLLREITYTNLAEVLACGNGVKPAVTQVTLHAPANFEVSLPGKKIDENRFMLANRPCDWSSGVMWGNIANHELAIGDNKVRIAMPNTLPAATQAKLVTWIRTGFHALKLAYDDLPVREVQVLVFPVGENSEAVPWGEVNRGGGDAVHLYVDETKSLAALNADWVLVHELSHLLHPYLVAADGWLSEGIASYYQNVLRARAGLLTPERAWEKLDAGFKRGEKQFDPGVRLFENTRQMMRERQYMRVYWSGAAIAMMGDVELRRHSRGVQSLDTLLQRIAECCLPTENERWRGAALIKRFDDISQTNIFSRLYDRYVMQARFPEIETIYPALGLKRSPNGLTFEQDGAMLRRKIIRGR